MATAAQNINQSIYGDHNIVVGSGNITVVQPAPLSDPERDTRRGLSILVQRVRVSWVEGVLDKSVAEAALLELGMETRAQLLDASRLPPQENPSANAVLPAGKHLLDIFDEAGRMLLILGEPGSGKTTSLLRLARDLLDRAAADPDFGQPVPVVFNLSSWNGSLPVLEWMVQELAAKYGVARRIGQAWLANYRLLPLLDGLDEVQPERRDACVQAINHYVMNTGISGLVVCSRSDEYTGLSTRLLLNNAICLRPLTPDQILEYLRAAGEKMSGLRAAIQKNPTLMDLARSPLTLNIMFMAYEGAPEQALAQENTYSEAEWRHRLFNAYITRMLGRKSPAALPYTPENIVRWLAWLARKMVQHGQTVFLIEQLQPSWLDTRAQRWKYVLAARVMANMAINGIFFINGIFSGLVVGLVDGLSFDRQHQLPQISAPTRKQRARYFLLICLIFFGLNSSGYLALYGVILLLFTVMRLPRSSMDEFTGQMLLQFTSSAVLGLFPAIIIGIRGGSQTLLQDIRTVEMIKWSWGKALRGSGMVAAGIAVFATVVAVISAFLTGLRDAPSLALLTCLALPSWGLYAGMVALPFAGLSSKVAEGKMLPNQGIRMSVRNALRAGLGVSAALGVAMGIITTITLFFVALYMFTTGELTWSTGAVLGILVVAVSIFVMVVVFFAIGTGPYVAAWFGGFDAIYHYALRYRLEVEGLIPRGYEHFLNFAVERIFLRKVGGGYIFVHRLLMEHFASLQVESGPAR